MFKTKFFREENETNRIEIEKAESIWRSEFPTEYKEFLLKNNSGVSYPNYPTVNTEDNRELWPIERFLSIGDLILQKQYPMPYALHNIDKENFEEWMLDHNELLFFAQGERGMYFINLNKDEFGQIYFANFSGGDGIVRTECHSFNQFIGSLGFPDWFEGEYDPEFKLENLHYAENKIFKIQYFNTPENPELGLKRFAEVFKVIGDLQAPENGYPNIAQKYVDDRQKLEFLLSQGCRTEGLLNYAQNPNTIEYLVKEKGLDINQIYKGRFPLQNYLTPAYKYDLKKKYELIHHILELDIEIDWSIKGKPINGNDDMTMINKLKTMHKNYLEFELEDKQWWIKNGKPSGHEPFLRSQLIEEKLRNNAA